MVREHGAGEMPDFRPKGIEGQQPKFNRSKILTTVLQTKRTTNMKRAGRRNMMNCLSIAGTGDGAAGLWIAFEVYSVNISRYFAGRCFSLAIIRQ
jgi:hypothetical protein